MKIKYFTRTMKNCRLITALALFICIVNLPAVAQKTMKKVVITGRIVDADQKPLSGVIILIDNKKTDCVTDKDGLYRIKVSSQAKSITAISVRNGMKESSINGNDIINFILGPSAAWQQPDMKPVKDDAVNVGYGSSKKKVITTNATKIDAENPKFASHTNIYDMIRSEIPGVRGTGTTLYLVEPSSLMNSNEPLIIVDGATVSNLDNIAPSMVKSIDILKGAAASIYGTRGSNGVILITLKRGEKKK